MNRRYLLSLIVLLTALAILPGTDNTESKDITKKSLSLVMDLKNDANKLSFAEVGFTTDTAININGEVNKFENDWVLEPSGSNPALFSGEINIYWKINSIIPSNIRLKGKPMFTSEDGLSELNLEWLPEIINSPQYADDKCWAAYSGFTNEIISDPSASDMGRLVHKSSNLLEYGYKTLRLSVNLSNLSQTELEQALGKKYKTNLTVIWEAI